ncbi:3'(2'),5'-bisphosphate nucleotidase [Savitreella phatthalungensis]
MASLLYAKELKVAELAVARAAKLTTLVFRDLVNKAATLTKEDKSPVTVADFGAQAIVNACLRQACPDIPIVGEEDAADLRKNPELKEKVWALVKSTLDEEAKEDEIAVGKLENADQMLDCIDLGTYEGGASGLMWALDPIDGTKGFLRAGQYAVCLGLIEDGKPVLGAIACPNLPVDPSQPEGTRGLLFSAVTGAGAYSRPLDNSDLPKRILFNKRALEESTFCESVESGHSAHDVNAAIAQKLGITKEPVRMDSQAKYCSISRGDGDIYLRLPVSATYEEKIWDHTAGNVLVHEAGGKVSDMHGNPLDFGKGRTLKSKGVVAAEASVFDKVIDAVKQST